MLSQDASHVNWRYRGRRVLGLAWRHGNCDSSHQTPNLTSTSRIATPLLGMVYASGFALCAAITGAAALQIPLLSTSNQVALGHPEGDKPLVNSTELQDLISGDRLMTRAKKLYDIAKLGEDEYNHPTRVIGSAGRCGQSWV